MLVRPLFGILMRFCIHVCGLWAAEKWQFSRYQRCHARLDTPSVSHWPFSSWIMGVFLAPSLHHGALSGVLLRDHTRSGITSSHNGPGVPSVQLGKLPYPYRPGARTALVASARDYPRPWHLQIFFIIHLQVNRLEGGCYGLSIHLSHIIVYIH